MFPSSTTAASLLPSLEEATPFQSRTPSAVASSVQEAPESAEVQTLPPLTVATRRLPSLEEAIADQRCRLATAVHVAPESAEVQMFPS